MQWRRQGPNKERLPEVWEKLFAVYPEGWRKPLVVPMQDGRIHFCWEDGMLCPTIDYDVDTDRAYFHAWAFEEDKDEVEREFDVKDAETAKEMWLLVKRTLDEAPPWPEMTPEEKLAWHREAMESLREFKRTGLHITSEEFEEWVEKLETDPHAPMPECHT